MSPREAAHSRFFARCFSKWLWLCSIVGGLGILVVIIARAGRRMRGERQGVWI